MDLASEALVASMVWVTDLSRRTLSNEMLRFSPLKTWLAFRRNRPGKLTDQEVGDGFDVIKVKKELMGSQIWSMVVTWARMASMASMVAPMASTVSGSEGSGGWSDSFQMEQIGK